MNHKQKQQQKNKKKQHNKSNKSNKTIKLTTAKYETHIQNQRRASQPNPSEN